MSRTQTPEPTESLSHIEPETRALLSEHDDGAAIGDIEARVRFPSSRNGGDESPGSNEIDNEDCDDGESNPARSFLYILLLTVVIGGLQLSWSAEFSNGTVRLLLSRKVF